VNHLFVRTRAGQLKFLEMRLLFWKQLLCWGNERLPVESPEIDVSNIFSISTKGPPLIYQIAGAFVVYTATGAAQASQVPGVSQQYMCAGVPHAGMMEWCLCWDQWLWIHV
jgi:hypothetical protein